MVGVHILAQQGDLARPLRHHPPRLGHDARHRARGFRPARIGHHAKGAEFVAAFLDGQVRDHPLRRRRVGQKVKLLLGRKIRVDHRALAAMHLRDQLRQPMISLRAHHHVHIGRALEQNIPLRLGHAAGHRDHHPVAGGFLQVAQPPQGREHLLRRPLADVACVHDHHVRALGAVDGGVAQGRQHVGHARAIIHVHLAAMRHDVQSTGITVRRVHLQNSIRFRRTEKRG